MTKKKETQNAWTRAHGWFGLTSKREDTSERGVKLSQAEVAGERHGGARVCNCENRPHTREAQDLQTSLVSVLSLPQTSSASVLDCHKVYTLIQRRCIHAGVAGATRTTATYADALPRCSLKVQEGTVPRAELAPDVPQLKHLSQGSQPREELRSVQDTQLDVSAAALSC